MPDVYAVKVERSYRITSVYNVRARPGATEAEVEKVVRRLLEEHSTGEVDAFDEWDRANQSDFYGHSPLDTRTTIERTHPEAGANIVLGEDPYAAETYGQGPKVEPFFAWRGGMWVNYTDPQALVRKDGPYPLVTGDGWKPMDAGSIESLDAILDTWGEFWSADVRDGSVWVGGVEHNVPVGCRVLLRDADRVLATPRESLSGQMRKAVMLELWRAYHAGTEIVGPGMGQVRTQMVNRPFAYIIASAVKDG